MVDEKTRDKFKIQLIRDHLTITDIATKWGYSRQFLYSVLSGRKENLRIEYLIYEYTRTDSR